MPHYAKFAGHPEFGRKLAHPLCCDHRIGSVSLLLLFDHLACGAKSASVALARMNVAGRDIVQRNEMSSMLACNLHGIPAQPRALLRSIKKNRDVAPTVQHMSPTSRCFLNGASHKDACQQLLIFLSGPLERKSVSGGAAPPHPPAPACCQSRIAGAGAHQPDDRVRSRTEEVGSSPGWRASPARARSPRYWQMGDFLCPPIRPARSQLPCRHRMAQISPKLVCSTFESNHGFIGFRHELAEKAMNAGAVRSLEQDTIATL